MIMNPPIKPIRLEGEFSGMSVTIQTSSPLDDPNATLRCVGEERGCPLRIERSTGCTTVVHLHEDIALLGEGHYEVVLMDGCDECGKVPLVMSADCCITSVTTEAKKPGKKSCD